MVAKIGKAVSRTAVAKKKKQETNVRRRLVAPFQINTVY